MRRHAFAGLLALTAGLLIAPSPAHAAATPARTAPLAGPAGTVAAAGQVLSPTPYQGWNTYYGLGGEFTEESVTQVADALVSRGLAKAGYDIVWLDGGWQDPQPAYRRR